MTPEQKRIAIAEACGWRNIECYSDNAGPDILSGEPPPTYKRHKHDSKVPDYLNDLNAMHEAVMLILNIAGQRDRYKTHLRDVVHRAAPYLSAGRISFLCLNATATQCAEAFGLTLELW